MQNSEVLQCLFFGLTDKFWIYSRSSIFSPHNYFIKTALDVRTKKSTLQLMIVEIVPGEFLLVLEALVALLALHAGRLLHSRGIYLFSLSD